MTIPTDASGHPIARGSANEPYYYRRRLGARDLWVAAGIGAGAGIAAFYIASLFLQRTPLQLPREGAAGDDEWEGDEWEGGAPGRRRGPTGA